MNLPFVPQAAATAVVVLLALPSARAAPPSTLRGVVVPSPMLTVTVSCANPQWPSLQEMGRQFGNDALDPLYRVRKRMMLAGHRACREGVDAVNVTFEPAGAEPVRALAVR